MKSIHYFAFIVLTAFTSSESLIDLKLIKKKWELVKTINLTEKSVFVDEYKTLSFSDEYFTLILKENDKLVTFQGNWNYIEESKVLDCRIKGQQHLYIVKQLTNKVLTLESIELNSGNRILEEYDSSE